MGSHPELMSFCIAIPSSKELEKPRKMVFYLGGDCMRWADSFVARKAILYHFKTNMAISGKRCWNCFTIKWGELKASWLVLPCWLVFEKRHNSVGRARSSQNLNAKKFDVKQNGKRAQASTLQQEVQIQILNLNGRMNLLRIYSKLSVILRQWWSSRIKILTQTNHGNKREVRKEIVKINDCYVEYFGPVSLALFPNDMNDEEEIRCLSTLMFHPHFFLFTFFLSLL